MSTAFAQPETSLQPKAGESYAQYVQRAHYALMAECPDWEERNERVWSNWEAQRGDNLRQRAKQYFSANRFVPNVCYFSEHETIGRDGRPVRYSFHELSEIVDEHNSRADRHNYSALASKHTVDGVLPENLEPKVVGFVGSARLGMVGNENPQWAAFFDEHHKTDKYSSEVLADKQRRSVEVNRYKDGRRPYFDPVAVLGADSPRLPLPVARYSDDGAMIDRYSVVAPAQVSGTNSFIPSFGSDQKPRQHQYSEQPNMGPSQLSPQDVQAIVQAIQSTPEMEWVRNQMGTGGPSSAGGGGNGPDQAAPGGAPPAPPQPQGQQYMSHQPPLPRYSADDDDLMLTEKYSQLESEFRDLQDKYSRVHEINTDLMRQHSQTRQAVIELEKRNCDIDREMQIKDLYQKYPHFVNVDEELDRALYSRGSEMDVDQFASHIEAVERYAQRSSPVTGMIPKGTIANPVADKDRYEAQVADMIVERYTRYEKQGEYRTYDQLEAEIRKELAGN